MLLHLYKIHCVCMNRFVCVWPFETPLNTRFTNAFPTGNCPARGTVRVRLIGLRTLEVNRDKKLDKKTLTKHSKYEVSFHCITLK